MNFNNSAQKSFEQQLTDHVLETAIMANKYNLDAGTLNWFGKGDPTQIDTYANLLYKAGKNQEALEREQRAFELSEGQDKEITGHLERMKAGEPTWPIPQ